MAFEMRALSNGLHSVVVERRRKNHVRHFHFALDEFFQNAKSIQPWHLHIQKYQVRRVFLDQSNGFHTVFSLPDHVDFRKTFQQVRQLVARRLFVIHDDGVYGHLGLLMLTPGSRPAPGSYSSTHFHLCSSLRLRLKCHRLLTRTHAHQTAARRKNS